MKINILGRQTIILNNKRWLYVYVSTNFSRLDEKLIVRNSILLLI